MTEHTGASYDAIAAKYAAVVDTSPWNAHYERPAMLSQLPTLEGANVLDAGCGSGWYAEYLLSQGASVASFDLNAEFVRRTQARVGQKARVVQADLAQPLDFCGEAEFDLVIAPLVLHYLKDWVPTLREFHRVLKPEGVLVFSTHHPTMDWRNFNTENYFALELLEDEWEVGRVRFYRRPLTAISEALATAGFCMERLLEPTPTEAFRRINPEACDHLSKNPGFLIIRASKRSAS